MFWFFVHLLLFLFNLSMTSCTNWITTKHAKLSGPRGLGHIVAGILCALDWTNVCSILLAAVGASKRLPSEICLISCMFFFLFFKHIYWIGTHTGLTSQEVCPWGVHRGVSTKCVHEVCPRGVSMRCIHEVSHEVCYGQMSVMCICHVSN